MTAIRLAVAFLLLVLLLGAGVWYYLFGPNKIAAADLVPSDTVAFATIPNAARIVSDYGGSQIKQLVDAPEAKPLLDSVRNAIGDKNLDLLQSFLPSLSGQSFLAVTHYDPANPARVGLIAGLKPKPGAGNFSDFVEKWKETYPELMAQGTTGAGQVESLDYEWIRGPGASDKICVAKYNGWIITTWGEDSLRDWWERLEKKSTTPSLSKNADYQKSLQRLGIDSEAILYLDFHAIMGFAGTEMAKTNPAGAKYYTDRMSGIGPFSIGTKFEHGEIADRFSLLMPQQTQAAAGLSTSPCAFDTLKFTSPDTRLYWGSAINFSRVWANLQERATALPATSSAASTWVTSLQNWAQGKGLDVEKNIVAPLGNEISAQVEWRAVSSYPEAGLFVKLDHPDDFKPTIAAFIDTIRQTYINSAVINEINSGGQNFATLKFIQSLPISPTITEDGPYLGVFLTENQAVRSFKRDASVGLLANDDFKAQIGDREKTASQVTFLDSPRFIDRGYQTALPYLSIAAMFNRTLSGLIHGRTLPPDLQWLAPIGTWSFTTSSDEDGINGYSISGIGNQGIILGAALGGSIGAMQYLGHPGVPVPFPPGAASPPPLPIAQPSLPPPSPTVVPISPGTGADSTMPGAGATPAPSPEAGATNSVSSPPMPAAPSAAQPDATVPPPDSTPASAPPLSNAPPASAPATNQ